MKQFFGKYRAIVTKVEGSKYNTRIKVKCPSVLGESPSAWCNPCLPFIMSEKAFIDVKGSSTDHTHVSKSVLQPPKVGDPVWVEFEGGDLTKPIWVGTWR